jgi:VWFA-related protein
VKTSLLVAGLSVPLVLGSTRILREQQPVFRSTTDAVVVDVSVTARGRPVLGLAADDFQLLDNGVPQRIDKVALGEAPVDVSLLLDTSGSAWIFGNRLVGAANEVRGLLEQGDRAELITFDNQIRRSTVVRTDGRGRVPMRIKDGGTALFDAICAAAMESTEPGRRHLIVELTDGLDTQSFLGRNQRQAILARSNAVVYIVAISVRGRAVNTTVAPGVTSEPMGDYDYLLAELTDVTGGELIDFRPGSSFSEPLRQAIAGVRTRYTLWYQPNGVSGTGWHKLVVTVPRRDYDLRARRGYFR